MPRLRHSDFSSTMRRCMAMAMSRQALASSRAPLVSGSPKKARMASPMNLSTVAPCSCAIFDISVKYSLSRLVSSSGCRCSAVSVKSLMSEKKMVSFLRSVEMTTSFSPEKIDL